MPQTINVDNLDQFGPEEATKFGKVHVLRNAAKRLFPGEIEREFLEDVADLCNINSGIQAQLKVLDRIRWGYAKWLR